MVKKSESILFLSISKGNEDLENKRSERFYAVRNFFKERLKFRKKSIFGNQEGGRSDLSFQIKCELPEIIISITLLDSGEVHGKCFRNLYHHKSGDLLVFYKFYLQNEKELIKETRILNFFLKTL